MEIQPLTRISGAWQSLILFLREPGCDGGSFHVSLQGFQGKVETLGLSSWRGCLKTPALLLASCVALITSPFLSCSFPDPWNAEDNTPVTVWRLHRRSLCLVHSRCGAPHGLLFWSAFPKPEFWGLPVPIHVHPSLNCLHLLMQGSLNYGSWAKPGSPPVFVNKVSLEHSPLFSVLFMAIYNSRVKQKWNGLQSLKYVLIGPLRKVCQPPI